MQIIYMTKFSKKYSLPLLQTNIDIKKYYTKHIHMKKDHPST